MATNLREEANWAGNYQLLVLPMILLSIVGGIFLWKFSRCCVRGVELRNIDALIDDCSQGRGDLAEQHMVVINVDPTKEENEVQGRRKFTFLLVQEAKNRFGCPERTKPNLLAVRKFLLDSMVKRGVRPSHINIMIPVCVELVFVKNDAELLADRLAEVWADREMCFINRWIKWVCRCGRRNGVPLRTSTL
jgi:hypothetical protein